MEGQDVVYKDIIEPLESVSVTVEKTDKQNVSEFGSPEEVRALLQLWCDSNQQVTGAADSMESVSTDMSASGSPEGWGICCSGHSSCRQQHDDYRHSPAWQLRCMLSACQAICS